ncbi:uncharacterized protein LOC114743299 [Neltuma alba]|uniref:uncharacterized protein LOC114743299 n=1 Tax=Neltuma alba TaxID=207710 RepID=UPI0010A56F46|nr:uncharacterized protein LOC114743299 [Prosopis alba]
MLSSRFSFLGGRDSGREDHSPKVKLLPILKLEADKEVYRPGDPVVVTIEISNPSTAYSFLVERLSFEIKSIEKLDAQWFATQKPLLGSKQKRDVVRMLLPSIVPPSYKGSTVRYFYYVKSALMGEWLVMENGQSFAESVQDVTNMVRANDINDGLEEGYDSSRDEVSSVSSYNPVKHNLRRSFGSSLSLRLVLKLTETILFLSILDEKKFRNPFSAEEDAGVASSSEAAAINSASSEGFIRGRSYNIRLDDQVLLKFSPKNSDSNYYFSDMIGGTLTFFHEERARRCLEVSITLETSETINRRFVHPSRKHSPTITKVQSDHYEVVADLVQTSFLFSISMDGPMSFSTPRVSVQWVLRFEFYATPKNLDWTKTGQLSMAVDNRPLWFLNLKYEHPLLIEGREKCEWVLPITVHAPPSRTSGTRREKPVSLDPLWVHN